MPRRPSAFAWLLIGLLALSPLSWARTSDEPIVSGARLNEIMLFLDSLLARGLRRPM
jgi:hypothetical protein